MLRVRAPPQPSPEGFLETLYMRRKEGRERKDISETSRGK